MKRKPYIKKNRFYNTKDEKLEGFFFKSLSMLLKSLFVRKKLSKAEKDVWSCRVKPLSYSVEPVITWLGHASFLIQVGGVNIITDPIFGQMSRLYPRCLHAALNGAELPNIDFVLISHNHRDHMDAESLMSLQGHSGITFLVPQGDKLWFEGRSFARVREYSWWDNVSFKLKYDLSKEIKFTFLPAKHWSQRGLFDRNKSLWGSWMIECNGQKIYFAGDTSYHSHFSEISQEFRNIDIALMPIGPCEPREWIKHTHLNVSDAGKAFVDLRAKHFVPMHWGAFPLGVECYDAPILLFKKWWKEHALELQNKKLHVLKVGQQAKLDLVPFQLKEPVKESVISSQRQL